MSLSRRADPSERILLRDKGSLNMRSPRMGGFRRSGQHGHQAEHLLAPAAKPQSGSMSMTDQRCKPRTRPQRHASPPCQPLIQMNRRAVYKMNLTFSFLLRMNVQPVRDYCPAKLET